MAQVRQYCRVEIPDDDTLISSLITAARIECEQRVNRSFVYTDWLLTLDYFPPYSQIFSPVYAALGAASGYEGSIFRGSFFSAMDRGAIRLPYPPLYQVNSISYLAMNNQITTLDLGNVAGVPPQVVVSLGTPGRITPVFGRLFPPTLPVLGSVAIRYTAGYGPGPDNVPAPIVQAITMLATHYYEHRLEDAREPSAINSLLRTVEWSGGIG